MPFGSLVHSDDCGLHSHFAPDRLILKARGIPQILWSKRIVTRTSGLSQHHAELRSRREALPFRYRYLIQIILCIFRRYTLQIACPRSPRACIPPVLTEILWLQIRADNSFQSPSAQDRTLTQRPRVFSCPLYKDRHTCHQAFFVIVHRLEAHGKRDSASSAADTLWLPKFSSRNSLRLFWKLSGHDFGSQSKAFFFFQQILLPVV